MLVIKDPSVAPYAPSYVLPSSLDGLHGPRSGRIKLPNHLLWNPSEPFNLSDDDDQRAVLRIVLREARNETDLAQYVNPEALTRLWPGLGLPRRVRSAWEQKFPELAMINAR